MIEYFPPVDNAKDYIRRGDLLFKSTFRDGIFDNSESTLQRLDHYYVSLRQVYEAPAADVVEVRHGQWFFKEYEFASWCTKAICSSCKKAVANNSDLAHDWGQKLFLHDYKFCPNCGAKMDGGQDDA